MKPVNQIIQTKEYKQHTFTAAVKDFACESDVSLYYDSISNIAIIYHLKNSKNINVSTDEIKVTCIPSFLEDIEDNISEKTYDRLQEIYDQFMKIASQYEYEDDCKPDIFTAYGIQGYPEMWESKEFTETFKKDVAGIVKRLQPIQDLVNDL